MATNRKDDPTDVKAQQRSRLASRFRVSVTEGPDAGASFDVDASLPSRVFVGQAGGSGDLKLQDRHVSRRHLALQVHAGKLRATDLESTNGTSVNGLSIVEALLEGGEIIRMGSTTLHVTRLEDAEAQPLALARSFGRIIGASSEMRRLYPVFERLAGSDITVLIEGETGTGKELLAETLHEKGKRASGPFIVFDCATVSKASAPLRLFGNHEGGTPGVFEQADGGTLFLDEIGELDLEVQAKLLRAIERGEIRRIADDSFVKVDVRVIAATNFDLERAIQEERFRDDLYFRLALARIELPPLRARRGDIGELARHFWQLLGGDKTKLPYAAIEQLESHSFPGNVRELNGVMLRHVELGESAEATSGRAALASKEPSPLASLIDPTEPYAKVREAVIRELERRYVDAIVQHHGGNVQRAAIASGLALRYFQVLRARHREP